MAASHLNLPEINPDTKILDDEGRDWTWAYVLFSDLAIPGAVGYKIDTRGNAWTCKGHGYKLGMAFRPWKLLNPYTNDDGYLRVVLRINGINKHPFVHRLVLEAFVGPCPEGNETCHNNGVPSDCRLVNLRWGTPESNMMDKVLHGKIRRGEDAPGAKYSEEQVIQVCEMLQRGDPPWKISRAIGVGIAMVANVRSRRYWKHISEGYFFPLPVEANRACGTMNWRSGFSREQVREIRRLAGEGLTGKELQRLFGGSVSNMYKIMYNRSYIYD